MRKVDLIEIERIDPNSVANIQSSPELSDIYGFYYNVECFWGNGDIQTFNAKLENAGGGYFWFVGKDGALFKIKQSRVLMMVPTERVEE